MNKTQLRLIDEAFHAIPDLYDGFKQVADRLFEMNLQAERRHRKGSPYGIKHGISAQAAARLFTVSHLLDGFAEPDRFTVDDILNIRNEILYAQAYAKRHHAQLAAWAEKYQEAFKQVDYSKLMQTEEK